MIVVEIIEIAAHHIDCAKAEPDGARIDQVEIHQTGKRLLQRRGVIETDGRHRIAGDFPRGEGARREEAGNAGERAQEGRGFVEPFAHGIAIAEKMARQCRGDPVPEGSEIIDALIDRAAGNDRRVDRADGNAGQPVRADAGRMQRLIGTCLIGAKRPAALKDENGLLCRDGDWGYAHWMLSLRRPQLRRDNGS